MCFAHRYGRGKSRRSGTMGTYRSSFVAHRSRKCVHGGDRGMSWPGHVRGNRSWERSVSDKESHSRGSLVSPACWGTTSLSAPRSWRCTTGMTLRPLCVATRSYRLAVILTPLGGRIWAPCPTGSLGPVRAGWHLVDTEQQGPRPHSAEMLHCVQHDMYRTCIGRPGDTVYLLSAAQ